MEGDERDEISSIWEVTRKKDSKRREFPAKPSPFGKQLKVIQAMVALTIDEWIINSPLLSWWV